MQFYFSLQKRKCASIVNLNSWIKIFSTIFTTVIIFDYFVVLLDTKWYSYLYILYPAWYLIVLYFHLPQNDSFFMHLCTFSNPGMCFSMSSTSGDFKWKKKKLSLKCLINSLLIDPLFFLPWSVFGWYQTRN